MSFFPGFALGTVGGAFFFLEEAGRHGPEPFARLDRPFDQEEFILPGDHRADHHQRIDISHKTAVVADQAFAIVALGHAAVDRALGGELAGQEDKGIAFGHGTNPSKRLGRGV